MTDKDVIDGLACCGRYGTGCAECPYKGGYPCSEILIDDASALVDRLQAEIERLHTENNQFADIGKMYSEIRAEAIKEFANRLKDAVIYIPWCDYPPIHRAIDDILKNWGDGDDYPRTD